MCLKAVTWIPNYYLQSKEFNEHESLQQTEGSVLRLTAVMSKDMHVQYIPRTSHVDITAAQMIKAFTLPSREVLYTVLHYSL